MLARLEAADLQERVNEQTALVATERARLALTRKSWKTTRTVRAELHSKLAFDELDSNFLVSQAQLRHKKPNWRGRARRWKTPVIPRRLPG